MANRELPPPVMAHVLLGNSVSGLDPIRAEIKGVDGSIGQRLAVLRSGHDAEQQLAEMVGVMDVADLPVVVIDRPFLPLRQPVDQAVQTAAEVDAIRPLREARQARDRPPSLGPGGFRTPVERPQLNYCWRVDVGLPRYAQLDFARPER